MKHASARPARIPWDATINGQLSTPANVETLQAGRKPNPAQCNGRADVLLLNKLNARYGKRLLAALRGFDVNVVESWPELTRRLKEGCNVSVVVCGIRSTGSDCVDVIATACQLALYKPMVVIDETIDAGLGNSLIATGAQDYLSAACLQPDELQQTLEKAVLRHPHRLGRRGPLVTETASPPACDSPVKLLDLLSPSEREVLDLFLGGLNAKKIAGRLRKRPKTVYSQMASIRDRFQVRSNQELVIRCMELDAYPPPAMVGQLLIGTA